MAKRRWTDAPPAERCAATVTLRDGTTAQCGRRKVEGDERCWQHQRSRPRSAAAPPQERA